MVDHERRARETYYNSDQNILDFIQITRYQRPFQGVAYVSKDGGTYIVAPPQWEVHRHPNGDVYFYNPVLRLITPDDITDYAKLELVEESWEEHVQNMMYDPVGRELGDDCELILSDVTESSVMIEVISRNSGRAYKWSDETGLQSWEDKAHYWSLLAEYPSHHKRLPPGVEDEFVKRVFAAKAAVERGQSCPLTCQQIDQVIARYKEYRNSIPMVTWLIGVILPLKDDTTS